MNAARQHPWLAAGLVLAAGAAAWAFWPSSAHTPPGHAAGPEVAPEPPPPDPRLAFDTPYRNVKPGVRYVGDAACAGCHADIDKSYHQHPMGRSAARVGEGPAVERYGPAVRDPFTVQHYTLRVDHTPGGVVHRVSAARPDGEPLPDYAVRADVAIGSGARGRSYLTVDPGGAVWQSPLSWYGQEGRWDLSPGYDLGANGGRRAISSDCLFCHVDRVEPVPGSRNRFREPLLIGQAAIGCERCHGPGELHVAERAGGAAPAGVDTSIVNPKHLPPDLKASVCAQCHLQGQQRTAHRGRDVWDFRPGLPFEQFAATHLRHPDLAEAHRSVGQFEQMEASKCYTASGGRLGCVSCHDPHLAPAPEAKAAFYRARCNSCHQTKGCTAPEPDRAARADSCIACHMPRAGSSNIVHTSVTDHRVPRRPVPPAPPSGMLDREALPIVPYRPGPNAPPAAERDRAYAIALGRVSGQHSSPLGRRQIGGAAVDRLLGALRRAPDDTPAWLGMAFARDAMGDPGGRAEAARAAVGATPDSELALAELAEAEAAAGRLDAAEAAAARLIRLNPTAVDPRLTRVAILLQQKDWAAAEAECREAIRVHPLHARARVLLGVCRFRQGDPDGGRREVETGARLSTAPGQADAMRQMYRKETR